MKSPTGVSWPFAPCVFATGPWTTVPLPSSSHALFSERSTHALIVGVVHGVPATPGAVPAGTAGAGAAAAIPDSWIMPIPTAAAESAMRPAPGRSSRRCLRCLP